MSGKTWDHWKRLALWPLGNACQLVYGEDPKGMLPEDIANHDIDGRPNSVSLYHQAISAIKAGTLSTVVDLEVRPAEFLAWAQGQGVPLLRELADIPCPPAQAGAENSDLTPLKPQNETPDARRARIIARHRELKAGGNRHPTKTVAEEERISEGRVRQLMNPKTSALPKAR
jgi:hypothetical protein